MLPKPPSLPAYRRLAAATAALVASALMVTAGCGAEEPEGRFELSGIRLYNDCLEQVDVFEPEFFAARENLDAVGLFMQSNAYSLFDSDFAWFEVYQPGYVEDHLGEAVPVDAVDLTDPFVRGEMHFGESCPKLLASFQLQGLITFTSFEVGNDGIMEGEFAGQLIDARTGQVVAEEVTGTWRFPVEIGQPYRYFPSYPDDDFPTP